MIKMNPREIKFLEVQTYSLASSASLQHEFLRNTMEDELARLRARQHALWSRESSPSRESPPPALNNAACQERRHVGQLWVKVIQTVESQYSVSSPSSCTLFAVEASLLLLQRGLYLSTGMLDSILALAGGYKLDTHLDVDEVLLHVERYKVSMQLHDQGQV